MVQLFPLKCYVSSDSLSVMGEDGSNTKSDSSSQTTNDECGHDNMVDLEFDESDNENLATILCSPRFRYAVKTSGVSSIETDSTSSNLDSENEIGSIDDLNCINLENVDSFVTNGSIQLLSRNILLISRQVGQDGTGLTGIVGGINVQDCINNKVKKHERCVEDMVVSPEKEKKGFRKNKPIDPVMLMYRDIPELNEIIKRITTEEKPMMTISSETPSGGTQHLWEIKEEKDILETKSAFQSIESLYIADGHHRTSAACSSALENATTYKSTESKSSQYICSVLYAESEIDVLPYHRLVLPSEQNDEQNGEQIAPNQLIPSNELSYFSFLEAISKEYKVDTIHDSFINDVNVGSNEALMYLNKKWYKLSPLEHNIDNSDPLKSVSAYLLLEKILNPILNTDKNDSNNEVRYIDGREGMEGLVEQVDAVPASVAFFVSGITTQQIMAVADADKLLPAKATFIHPKPNHSTFLWLI